MLLGACRAGEAMNFKSRLSMAEATWWGQDDGQRLNPIPTCQAAQETLVGKSGATGSQTDSRWLLKTEISGLLF